MISGAIFDCDGTLLDTMPVWSGAASEYLESIGVQVDARLGEQFFEMTLPESAQHIRERFGIELSAQEIMLGIQDAVQTAYREKVEAKPGAKQFVKALAEHKIPMTIVSSGSETLIRPALARLGLEDYFQAIFASTETGLHKRQPTMFLQAARLMGSDPRNTWVFEDALYAVRVVRSANFHAIAVYDEASRCERAMLEAEADAYWEEFPPGIPDALLQ